METWSPFYYQHHHFELEDLLKQHHAIVDVGVVGVPDISQGELRFAYLCLQNGVIFDESLKVELNQFISEKFAKDCVPNHYYIVKELPKTRSGKLARQQLKTWAVENVQQA
ncbi:hypothetical protein BHU72_01250 [Desulfuribacillus stibiiarsenatis]|uniref:AMP-binding enzyme C-terminal domain-containing protein n=1 Tax=Desulfuribacillus stibiiarsenatis TaxID=1390249 RepID=A0A1E5L9U8_9FIRM|nr:acyl-CoA synthetase [Desulfuribacillus stibiiarsenatis]OEH86916.1 hypothetical protein BHU72_01250 [Desulfuribacillus stibiiarsenatis]